MHRRDEHFRGTNRSMPDASLSAHSRALKSSRSFDPHGARDAARLRLLVRACRCLRLFFFSIVVGGCASHGATTQNDASSNSDGAGGGDASAADVPAADAGSVDGGFWPCAPPADPTQPHPTLAATGCMDAAAITRFAPGAHRYEINSPLWSDKADKERAFVLPPG